MRSHAIAPNDSSRRTPKRPTLKNRFTLGACGFLAAVLTAIPSLAAEQITFFYEPLGKFPLSVNALETFAKDGQITPELEPYVKLFGSPQLDRIRYLLQQRFSIKPNVMENFSNAPVGQKVFRRLGAIMQTETGENGSAALRTAFIQAAADPQGVNLIGIIDKFPSPTIQINLDLGLKMFSDLEDLVKQRGEITVAVAQEADKEAKQTTINFAQQPDLRQPGSWKWQQIPLSVTYNARLIEDPRGREDRTVPVVVYLPQSQNGNQPPAATIVISHGTAEDQMTYAYLAQHLASHGFAIVVLEHPGSNAKRFEQFFAGAAPVPDPMEWVNRPLDVKYVLDELQRRTQSDPAFQNRLNLQQVGVLGHSVGGYTALALGGAPLNLAQLRRDCQNEDTLNLSMLLQCRPAELPPNFQLPVLQDERIKAVLAVNPLASSLLGQTGMSQIQVPVMLVAGSQDVFTPAVPEQIRPFTWLMTPNKYLVLIENGTHFSTTADARAGLGVFPVTPEMIGPNPLLARTYIQGLSLAFFQTYLLNRAESKPYLSAAYAKSISQAPLRLNLVQSFMFPQPTTRASKKGNKER